MNPNARSAAYLTLGLILLLVPAQVSYAGAPSLASVFGPHMVLQRDREIPVWGTADPGVSFLVTLDRDSKQVVADQSGRWRTRFAPRPASDHPITLAVTGSKPIVMSDILIGDVWICAGQSNMHWPFKLSAKVTEDRERTKAPLLRLLNLVGDPYPNGRSFTEADRRKCTPEHYLKGSWAVCSPSTVADFSAVAFYFGRALLDNCKVPIGLIHNAIGGTPAEAWINRESLAADPELRPLLKDWPLGTLVHGFCRDRASINLGLGRGEKLAKGLRHPYEPGFMYEAGILPIAPFGIRGVIWYQGESNAHNPALHDKLFRALLSDWRGVWGQGDFPFLFVQLPNMSRPEWPDFRESQRRASRLPMTGMAVTIDLGSPSDVHPTQKSEVGRRLALLARSIAYGEKVEALGPTVRLVRREGRSVRIHFSHADGLKTKGGTPLTGFELSGEDGVFRKAVASLQGSDITINAPDVPNPTRARFAHEPNPSCILINAAGLPASPFLIDITE